jgi:hypothetical protein
MAKRTNSEAGGEKKPNTRPQAFTPLNAKQAQEASVRSRNLRKQVRAQILNHIVTHLDLGAEIEKAIRSGDLDQINLLQTAIKMIGLHADQSEERQKTMSVSATTGTGTEGEPNGQSLKLEFEVVDPVKED